MKHFVCLFCFSFLIAPGVHSMTKADCYADVSQRLKACLDDASDKEDRRECYKTSNEERRECKDYASENSYERFQPTPIPQRPAYVLPGSR